MFYRLRNQLMLLRIATREVAIDLGWIAFSIHINRSLAMSSAIKTRDFAPTKWEVLKQPYRLPPQSPFLERKGAQDSKLINVRPHPRPFTDCDIVFAIDISQSTRGGVLAEECALIENFADSLTAKARDRLRVMPWDEIPHSIISIQDLPDIDPGGRTDPNVLLRNREQIDLLQNCHLWFLLTDGEIVPQTVRKFALGIASRGLHGTACIIVIFGPRPAKPILCNVSVGISVFGVSPNCMFLFHDSDTHTAYILQCKGCFNVLMPNGIRDLNVNTGTDWKALPQLNYVDVLNINVPPPGKLAATDFQLQSGHQINFNDLYSGNLGSQLENELLNNKDDLKSAILTAAFRGQSEDMQKWITSQRGNTAEAVGAPRPDVNGDAARLVRQAIKSMRDKPENHKPDPDLCEAHRTNWSAFAAAVEPREMAGAQVIDDALDRLAFIDEEGPSSPGALSASVPGDALPPGLSDAGNRRQPNRSRQGPRPGPQLLYSKGYRLMKDRSYAVGGYECCLCGQIVPVMALLLKQPPRGEATPNFPKPFSFSDTLFPLAMGNFRETDIISDFTCCDACSFFAIQYGTSPFNESLSGALLFGHEIDFNDDINKRTLLNTVQKALDGRLSRESTLLAFLAIVYDARDRRSEADSELKAIRERLLSAQDVLIKSTSMPYEVGNHTWVARIPDVVSHYLSIGTTSPGCDFLDHPIDSCIIMIRVCTDIKSIVPFAGTVALFHRLLLHFIEHAFVIQGTEFEGVAMDFYSGLRNLLVTEESSPGLTGLENFNYVSMQSLCDNHVASKEAIAALKPAVTQYWQLEHQCASATVLCLYLFNTINIGFTEPRQILNWFFERPELKFLFSDPRSKIQDLFEAAWEAVT